MGTTSASWQATSWLRFAGRVVSLQERVIRSIDLQCDSYTLWISHPLCGCGHNLLAFRAVLGPNVMYVRVLAGLSSLLLVSQEGLR